MHTVKLPVEAGTLQSSFTEEGMVKHSWYNKKGLESIIQVK